MPTNLYTNVYYSLPQKNNFNIENIISSNILSFKIKKQNESASCISFYIPSVLVLMKQENNDINTVKFTDIPKTMEYQQSNDTKIEYKLRVINLLRKSGVKGDQLTMDTCIYENDKFMKVVDGKLVECQSDYNNAEVDLVIYERVK